LPACSPPRYSFICWSRWSSLNASDLRSAAIQPLLPPTIMNDLIFIVVSVVFFAVSAGFIVALNRI
jgi:hypothetical protein